MNRKSFLIDLPLVEFWLIPVIFVLLIGVLSLAESQPLCSTTCPCIERAP